MQEGGEATGAGRPRGQTPVPELLAPAGDWSALQAGLEAGASAVYFGLRGLNARRYARNFAQDEFAQAVETVHAHGAKAYLTLNVDLAERELGLAARMLWWGRCCGIDGVLVRDPALLALRPELSELPFHFSTQSCITNSADVRAARALGIARVVLAREMTLSEIRSASGVAGVETEVFVQGALCFSVSGRCYLSSWSGGRSGNRGTCTSPCRVPWTADGAELGTPFSMRDLATVDRLTELHEAGVAGLKIEGRMKNADWVRSAVGLYRRALDGRQGPHLPEKARQLGGYTGRLLTCGYLDAKRNKLTGRAGREAGGEGPAQTASDEQEGRGESPTFDVAVELGPRGIECRCRCGRRAEQWSIPKTVVRRRHKAVPAGQLLIWLNEQSIEGCRAGRLTTNDPDWLLVPRAANKLVERITAVVRRAQRPTDKLIRIDLPVQLRRLLAKTQPSPANRLALGSPPDRVRLHASAVGRFLRHVRPRGMIVTGLTEGSLSKVRRSVGNVPLVVALPAVFFEEEMPRLRRLLVCCKQAGAGVEVNSWGGWLLAREAGLPLEGGPGIPVLNSLAARRLAEAGLRNVTISIEADRRQMEDLTAHCPVPCSLVVFGRPPLLTTRVALPEEQFRNRVLQDRRGVRITGRRERGLWVFRPQQPFDLRDLRNDRIRAAHLVADLVGSPDPVTEFRASPAADVGVFRFNYKRSLR